jgi:glycosyltransferase involved in cell wall biosynthesis
LGKKLDKTPAKYKVLHLIESLGSGGAERLLYTNLGHLDRATFESEVVTVFSKGDYWRSPIEQLGVRVRSLGGSGYRDIPKGIRQLRKVIAETRPDLIHTHLFAANVIGRIAGRGAGIPVISSIHNPEYEPEAVAAAKPVIKAKVRAARLIDRMTAAYGCMRMIAVSEYVRETTASRLNYPKSKIDVIYNPVDLSPSQDAIQSTALSESLGLEDKAFVILTVGRLAPQKGILHAIRAMPRILAADPKTHLVCVGAFADADYVSSIRAEISTLGVGNSVHLIGERRDIPALLAMCDIFLFPSLFEGLGIAIAEAMASGRACVGSRIRPLDEFVHHGRNGVLAEAGSPESIADAILSLMENSDLRKAIGAAAAVTAGEMFRPEPAARKLEEVYRSLLKGD